MIDFIFDAHKFLLQLTPQAKARVSASSPQGDFSLLCYTLPYGNLPPDSLRSCLATLLDIISLSNRWLT